MEHLKDIPAIWQNAEIGGIGGDINLKIIVMNLYGYRVAESLIDKYNDIEGSVVVQTREGVLGVGDWICTAPGKKTSIIKEVAIDAWSSGHSIIQYNTTPKKYEKVLSNI